MAKQLHSACRYSAELGLCPKSDAERITDHLGGCGLPTRLAEVGLGGAANRLVQRMGGDKKNSSGQLALILVRGIGKAFLDPNVDNRRLTDFLDRAG